MLYKMQYQFHQSTANICVTNYAIAISIFYAHTRFQTVLFETVVFARNTKSSLNRIFFVFFIHYT